MDIFFPSLFIHSKFFRVLFSPVYFWLFRLWYWNFLTTQISRKKCHVQMNFFIISLIGRERKKVFFCWKIYGFVVFDLLEIYQNFSIAFNLIDRVMGTRAVLLKDVDALEKGVSCCKNIQKLEIFDFQLLK